jgi:hypothetical protein
MIEREIHLTHRALDFRCPLWYDTPICTKLMTKLTKEQIKTLEDAFNSLPENLRTGTYRTMEGIEEQLSSGAEIIFYMRRGENIMDGSDQIQFVMEKMKVEK